MTKYRIFNYRPVSDTFPTVFTSYEIKKVKCSNINIRRILCIAVLQVANENLASIFFFHCFVFRNQMNSDVGTGSVRTPECYMYSKQPFAYGIVIIMTDKS